MERLKMIPQSLASFIAPSAVDCPVGTVPMLEHITHGQLFAVNSDAKAEIVSS